MLIICLFSSNCSQFALYQNAYYAAKDFIATDTFELNNSIISNPYAMELVSFENQTAVMVLAYADPGNRLTYLDSVGNSVILLSGKIIVTSGTINDMEMINPPNLNQIFYQLRDSNNHSITKKSLIRFSNPKTDYLQLIQRYRILNSVNSSYQKIIGEGETSYKLLEESFEIEEILWKGKNIYWVDDYGTVFKSKQYTSPNSSKFFLETLKAYSS